METNTIYAVTRQVFFQDAEGRTNQIVDDEPIVSVHRSAAAALSSVKDLAGMWLTESFAPSGTYQGEALRKSGECLGGIIIRRGKQMVVQYLVRAYSFMS